MKNVLKVESYDCYIRQIDLFIKSDLTSIKRAIYEAEIGTYGRHISFYDLLTKMTDTPIPTYPILVDLGFLQTPRIHDWFNFSYAIENGKPCLIVDVKNPYDNEIKENIEEVIDSLLHEFDNYEFTIDDPRKMERKG